MTQPDLTGQVAVIIGASSGIGAAAARRLHQLGATVHVLGRSPDRDPDGHKLMLGVNHLAPFLLTSLLTDLLAVSAPARMITTASARGSRHLLPPRPGGDRSRPRHQHQRRAVYLADPARDEIPRG